MKSSASPFQERDSAGIIIAESDGALARALIGWVVDPSPELQIGEVDGPEEYQLFRVRDIAQLPGGRIVVLNGGSQELRFYDRDGVFLHKTGRRGRGPGEFISPALIPPGVGDSLIIFDRSLRRFTVFNGSGRLLRTYNLGELSGLQISRVIGVFDDRFVSLHTIGFISQRKGLLEPDRVEYRLLWMHTWDDRILGQSTGQQWFNLVDDGQAFMYPVPFVISPSAAVGGTGIYINLGEGPEINEYDADGRTHRIIRLLAPPRETDRTDLNTFVAAQVASIPNPNSARTIKRAYESISYPKLMPAFDALLVDDTGWLWARIYDFDPAAPPVWLVFDPEGRAHGSVELPRDLEVKQIGADFVLGLWRDELGMQYVRRHKLSR